MQPPPSAHITINNPMYPFGVIVLEFNLVSLYPPATDSTHTSLQSVRPLAIMSNVDACPIVIVTMQEYAARYQFRRRLSSKWFVSLEFFWEGWGSKVCKHRRSGECGREKYTSLAYG